MRAGMNVRTSSARAEAQPIRARSSRYPSIASMVFTARYPAAPAEAEGGVEEERRRDRVDQVLGDRFVRGREDVVGVEGCRLTRDEHARRLPARADSRARARSTSCACSSSARQAKQDLRRNGPARSRRSGGANRPDDQVRGREERRRAHEARDADGPVPPGGPAVRPAPPRDHPAEQRDRMVRRMRVPDRPVDDERQGEDRDGYDRWVSHPTTIPVSSRRNAAKLTTSRRVTHQTR